MTTTKLKTLTTVTTPTTTPTGPTTGLPTSTGLVAILPPTLGSTLDPTGTTSKPDTTPDKGLTALPTTPTTDTDDTTGTPGALTLATSTTPTTGTGDTTGTVTTAKPETTKRSTKPSTSTGTEPADTIDDVPSSDASVWQPRPAARSADQDGLVPVGLSSGEPYDERLGSE